MEKWKKILKRLAFPPLAVMIILVPIATVLLVGSMVFLGTDTLVAYLSYVFAFYTLVVWCLQTPRLIKYFKRLKRENKYLQKWFTDPYLRVKATLYLALAGNLAFALFQLWLGFYHGSFWFYSLAAYYFLLFVMRSALARYSKTHKAGEDTRAELIRYRNCGAVFLLMNLALSVMVFFMVYWDKTFYHHQITTIALAAYTFTSLTLAIINVIKYRKYNNPIFSASKIISFASACVSMLTLESTMLTVFGDGTMDALTRKIFLGASGVVVCALVVAMAVYMLVTSTKKLKNQTKENEKEE